jgi:hypothetical protein
MCHKHNDETSEKNKKKNRKNNHEKTEKKEKFKNKDNVQKKNQKKKRDYKFDKVKEALQGMSDNMITKHKDAKANSWRCGREGHYTLECYAKKTEEGEKIVKVAVSSARKRQRNNDNTVSPTKEKRPKWLLW